MRKPLILNGLKGFFNSGMSLTPWFGTPSRYTVTTSTPRNAGPKIARLRRFMALPVRAPSGIFQFRRRVPKELRGLLGFEYKRSLKTSDPAVAEIREAEELLRCKAAFALARAQLEGVQTLTPRDIELLASRWYQTELAQLEASGNFARYLVDGRTIIEEAPDRYESHAPLVSLAEGMRDDPDLDISTSVNAAIKAALRQNNIPMPSPGSANHGRLTDVFRAHLLKLSDTALRRSEGDWQTKGSVLPDEPLSVEKKPPLKSRESKRLMSVFEDYAQHKVLTDGDVRSVRKTLLSFRATIQQFAELFGDVPVRDITRDVIRQYWGYMAQLPVKGEGIRKLSAKELIAKANAEGLPRIQEATIRNKLRTVSAVMGYALRMGEVDENPVIAGGAAKGAAKAATNRSAASRRRKEYNQEELRVIFQSPIYTQVEWAAPRADFGEAWYWMPLLMYYTGARREELAQLSAKDVLDQEGIWHLSILALEDDDDAGRSVKTLGSRRLIPLHPHLVVLGFLAYADRQKGGQLFPLLARNPDGYYGTNFGKRWAHYLRHTVGLVSPANPSHGFRHTFITSCRQVGISEEVRDAITGHAGTGSVSRSYGSMPLVRMAEEIKRIPIVPLR